MVKLCRYTHSDGHLHSPFCFLEYHISRWADKIKWSCIHHYKRFKLWSMYLQQLSCTSPMSSHLVYVNYKCKQLRKSGTPEYFLHPSSLSVWDRTYCGPPISIGWTTYFDRMALDRSGRTTCRGLAHPFPSSTVYYFIVVLIYMNKVMFAVICKGSSIFSNPYFWAVYTVGLARLRRHQEQFTRIDAGLFRTSQASFPHISWPCMHHLYFSYSKVILYRSKQGSQSDEAQCWMPQYFYSFGNTSSMMHCLGHWFRSRSLTRWCHQKLAMYDYGHFWPISPICEWSRWAGT